MKIKASLTHIPGLHHGSAEKDNKAESKKEEKKLLRRHSTGEQLSEVCMCRCASVCMCACTCVRNCV